MHAPVITCSHWGSKHATNMGMLETSARHYGEQGYTETKLHFDGACKVCKGDVFGLALEAKCRDPVVPLICVREGFHEQKTPAMLTKEFDEKERNKSDMDMEWAGIR
jgi:hypothetical protein